MTTSRAVRDLLARSGELAVLEAFGARVTADTCIVVAPLVKPDRPGADDQLREVRALRPRVTRRRFGLRHDGGVRRICYRGPRHASRGTVGGVTAIAGPAGRRAARRVARRWRQTCR